VLHHAPMLSTRWFTCLLVSAACVASCNSDKAGAGPVAPSPGSPASTSACPGGGSIVPPEVPAAIHPPGSSTVVAAYRASGSQIYVCKNAASDAGATFAWTLKAPDAVLYDETCATAGTHFAGPTWKLADGTSIAGSKVAQADAPDKDAIPWLLLRVTKREGSGKLVHADYVERVSTQGGVAPKERCDAALADTEARIAYAATYVFLAEDPH
jgi:hypothetical protein